MVYHPRKIVTFSELTLNERNNTRYNILLFLN